MAIKQIDYYGRFEATPADESTARRYRALAGLAEQVSDTALAISQRQLEKRAVQAEKGRYKSWRTCWYASGSDWQPRVKRWRDYI